MRIESFIKIDYTPISGLNATVIFLKYLVELSSFFLKKFLCPLPEKTNG